MYSVMYSCDELSADVDTLKDFDSRTEAMGLKCLYGNART